MKKITILFMALGIISFANAQSGKATKSEKPIAESVAPVTTTPVATPAAPAQPLPDVNKLFEFKNDAFDFGKIVGGKPTEYVLYIKNISNDSAELTHVQAGCGCTTPKYEAKKKFAKGETVPVTLGFNGGAAGSSAPFTKYVTVTLNGNLTKQVTFKGETFAPPAEPAPANGTMDKLKPAQK